MNILVLLRVTSGNSTSHNSCDINRLDLLLFAVDTGELRRDERHSKRCRPRSRRESRALAHTNAHVAPIVCRSENVEATADGVIPGQFAFRPGKRLFDESRATKV